MSGLYSNMSSTLQFRILHRVSIRMCGDVHILFQASNLPGAEAVVFDKTILGDFFLLHGFPQFIICNQGVAPPISLNTERL